MDFVVNLRTARPRAGELTWFPVRR